MSQEKGRMRSEQQENKVEPERLDELFSRYPIRGGIAISEQRFTFWRYDTSGHQLTITAQAGEWITYEESKNEGGERDDT